MKKIVALVLSLVMVLGLATTAFAAQGGSTLTNALANKDYTVEVKDAVAAAPAVKAFATYQLFYTKVADKSVTVVGPLAEFATEHGSTQVVVDGTSIRYFGTAAAYTVEVKAVELTAKAEYECGDLIPSATGTYYVDAKGNYYVAGGSIVGNVGGKMVYLADATVGVQGHNYAVDTKTVANKTTVTAVTCKDCKASFAFVEGTVADAVAKFGVDKYEAVPANVYADLFVAKTAGAVVAPEAGDKVESAETFDAGVAMYVGMSVMAAAGSAVVLKKKD